MNLNIKQLHSQHPDFPQQLEALLAFENAQDAQVDSVVKDIISAIRKQGDSALLEYTRRFDHLEASSVAELSLSRQTLHDALSSLPAEQRHALETAAERIRSFHQRQINETWSYQESSEALQGTMLGQRVTPIQRVGLYVPGGKAAYPSSVLMNAIPARVAGVGELIMVVPTPHGVKNQLVLAAAALAGVDQVFCIGGAQAIAALAYGTASIPRVDKIVGPGNAYVACAKRQVFGQVGIDMLAGPSEILIISDGATDPDWLAMDLFSQAEHDELAQSILISPDADCLRRVLASINKLLPGMPRRNIIQSALENRGALIEVSDLDAACALANRIAPEHLELALADPDCWVDKIQHAGAIFIGAYSSEALGDYCAGPNHVLPTSGSARFSSPLGVYDFQKRSSLIKVSQTGARTLGKVAAILATGEGLSAHAQSALYRC